MKIVTSIRDIFEDRKPLYEQLKQEVDGFFSANKKEKWHYESRIKTLNSFTLKAETGRFDKISELEDFFGACLVVENSSSVASAVKLIQGKFKIEHKRPKKQEYTHKEPDSFIFDDLRLYLVIPENPDRRPKGIEGVIFELQLKTYLQHAWSIATHQLIYKGENLSWASNRIAFQVKAMLEHAELSIMEFDKLADNYLVNKTNKKFKVHNQLVLLLKDRWKEEQLPDDMIRLVSNIRELMSVTKVTLQELKNICDGSRFVGKSPPKNISPQIAITLAIIDSKAGLVEQLQAKKQNLFLPLEGMGLLPEGKRKEVETVWLKPK